MYHKRLSHKPYLQTGILLLLLQVAYHSCSTTKFKSDPDTEDKSPKPQHINWNIVESCSNSKNLSDTVDQPQTSSSNEGSEFAAANNQPLNLIGNASKKLESEDISELSIDFSGRWCEATNRKRRVIFVVDTSGSMRTNDPVDSSAGTAGACARFNAVSAVIEKLGDQDSFRYITFSASIGDASADWESPIHFSGQSEAMKTSLCGSVGGTNYTAPLQQVYGIVSGQTAGDEVVNEVYFISDGQPAVTGMSGKEISGEIQAEQIKALGNTKIATVMLKGVDTIMESKIASRNSNGMAFHAFAGAASELTEKLAELSQDSITAATLTVSVFDSQQRELEKVKLDLSPLDAGGCIGGDVEAAEGAGHVACLVNMETLKYSIDLQQEKFSDAAKLDVTLEYQFQSSSPVVRRGSILLE